ncbi:MAG TPA: AAA family ATPase [Chloroflexota bacterium]|jgi:cell division protease FtsH|nr:AAA family ATPase [Chloroflexota bacterium]
MSTATQSQRPQVEEIESSIDSFFARLGRSWKTILIIAVLFGILWFVVAPHIGDWLQYILYGAFMLFQLLFAVLFMIVQFVALFWFLGRPRMYWILPGETGVGFKDYRGNPEVLETASRVVTLLKGVKEFKSMGGQVTRGILLVGPPGTGKSYLGHCISTEAGVPFGYLSAPSIQGMFWGMDVMRIWGLYNKARKLARKYGACILFIDEIDAIGRARSGLAGTGMGAMGGLFGGGGGALNQLLTEMDPLPRDDSWKAKLKRKLGFKVGRAEIPLVLTMGATNMAQGLDPALLRPGRFDRKIFVDYPDYDGRKEIIKYYLEKVAHEDLDLDRLASETIGQSPAAIKFIINEAVINAHFNGRKKINYEDFTTALDNHEVGLRHPIRNMLMEEKRALAYHEAGHAVAMLKLYKRMRVTRVTIIRHEGGVLGFAMPKPVQETYTTDSTELLAHIQVALAARASEELFLGTKLSGVFSDLQQATRAAAAYIGYLGMNGSLYSVAAFGEGMPDSGMKKEIDRLLREQFLKVKHLLDEHRELVVAVAETLLQRLELNGDDLYRIMEEVERRKIQGEALPDLPDKNAPVSVLDLLPTEAAAAATSAAYEESTESTT